MSIGDIIRYYRKKRNITQADLAVLMTKQGYPIKHGAISTWENNSSIPNANQFLVLCQILDIENWRDINK